MTAPEKYEYRFEDRSLLLRLSERPVLTPLVRALPRRLTPNQITVAGHLAATVGFGVVAIVRPASPAVLITLATAVLFYTVADCIDGLFARHSGQTSRLGELLDHWLDAVTVPLVVLSLALALPATPWLAFAAALVTAFMHYTTFAHGYRVGFVHLGAVGIIEGTCIGAAACVATAWFGPGLLGHVVAAGYTVADLLVVALVLGGLSALLSMPGLRQWWRDFGTLAVLLPMIAAWYAVGGLSAAVAGITAIAITSLFEGHVIRARLLRVPLVTTDLTLFALTLAGAGGVALFKPGATVQCAIALVISAYAFTRGAFLFAQSVRTLRASSAHRRPVEIVPADQQV